MFARIKAFLAKLWYGPPAVAESSPPPPHPTVPVPSKDPFLPGWGLPKDAAVAPVGSYSTGVVATDCTKADCKKDECKKPVVPARAATCGSSCGTPATHSDNGPDLMTTLLVTSVLMDTPSHAPAAVSIPDPAPTYAAQAVEMIVPPAPSVSPPAVTFSEPAPSYSPPPPPSDYSGSSSGDYGGGGDYGSSSSSGGDYGGGGDF